MSEEKKGVCSLLGESCSCVGESEPGTNRGIKSSQGTIFAKKSRKLVSLPRHTQDSSPPLCDFL